MHDESTRRRSYGTGSLERRSNADGSESWIAVWREHGRKRKETLGRVRDGRGGLSEKQANERLATLRGRSSAIATRLAPDERMVVAELSRRYLLAPARGGRARKPSQIQNVRSETRIHLEPFFGEQAIDAISAEDVAELILALQSQELASKTVRNVIGTLSALFNYACAPRRRWATVNPCEGAELPALEEPEEIRFLTLEELYKLVEHTRPGIYHKLDRVLYLVAAMTGLRLGELIALRWRDVDWTAGVVRVRRNYVRGEFGTPKSRRSTRSVPMADEVGGELERYFKLSPRQGDDDLVFGHPATGDPIPGCNVARRLHLALEDADLDDHVFHHLRHTFGTTMAAAGVPLRTLQEWMGHKHITTTERYADYAPRAIEGEWISAAFSRAGTLRGQSEPISGDLADMKASKHRA